MTEPVDPNTDEHPFTSEPPSEEDVKRRALDAIADLVSVAIQNASPGSFARAEVYCEAAALIERGPKQKRGDAAAAMMPMVTEVITKYFGGLEGPNPKSRLVDEMHQLAHTREMMSPADKEAHKAINERISEIAKALGPEQTAAIWSIAPGAPEAPPAS
jgi:hypothetical protein